MKLRITTLFCWIATAILLTFAAADANAQVVCDSVFFSNSRPVIFSVNSTKISKADSIWICDVLRPELERLGPNGIIYGRSSASPDGPLPNNIRLAAGRRDAALRYLSSHGFDVSKIRFTSIAEDYDMLLHLMKEAGDPVATQVDSIMRKWGSDPVLLKTSLQQHNGGLLWKVLLQKYFPQLRAVRIMVCDKRLVESPAAPSGSIAPSAPSGSSAQLSGATPVPVVEIAPLHPVEVAPTYNDCDSTFLTGARPVIFKVNSTVVSKEDATWLAEVLRPELENLRPDEVIIGRSAASPEGDYNNNVRLANARRDAALAYLSTHGFDTSRIRFTVVPEDYEMLVQLMLEAHDPDYSRVGNIVIRGGNNHARIKANLQQLDGGAVWNRILREYFPQLRSTRFVICNINTGAKRNLVAPATSKVVIDTPTPSFQWTPITLEAPEFKEYARRHLIAARTNLLHDFFYMPSVGWSPSPNIQFEYYPLDGHYTYNVGMTWGTHRHWDRQEFFQMRDFQFELRRYFRGGGEFMGTYLGAFLEGNVYGIGLGKKDGWEGEGGGAGLTIGYVMPLNKKKNLRLEFMAAAGLYRTYYDPYVYGNPVTGTEDGKYYYNYLGTASAFKKRNHVMTWLGPTNLGIQLTYDIIYRKKHLRIP